MSVYFIESSDLIKIGFSNDVRSRVRSVIATLREGGKFLGCMPGDRTVEQHLHKRFAEHREYGEWFRRTPELEGIISILTTGDFPEDEKTKAADRLMLQEERYAEEAAYFLRRWFDGVCPLPEHYDVMARLTTIPALRLEGIYQGQICPITAGEYVVIRQMFDAATNTPDVGLRPLPEDEREFVARMFEDGGLGRRVDSARVGE